MSCSCHFERATHSHCHRLHSQLSHAKQLHAVVQRRQAEQERAHEAFSSTQDMTFIVDIVFQLFKGDADYSSQLSNLERLITTTDLHPFRLYLPVSIRNHTADHAPKLMVAIGDALADLPGHMQAILFDLMPPAPRWRRSSSGAAAAGGSCDGAGLPAPSPQDVCPLPVVCTSWHEHLEQCASMANMFATLLQTGPEHRVHATAALPWPGIQVCTCGLRALQVSHCHEICVIIHQLSLCSSHLCTAP